MLNRARQGTLRSMRLDRTNDSSGAFSARPDQYFCRDAEARVQTPDHADGQSAFTVEHLGDAGARADEFLQVPPGEALLLHTEFDRLDRIGWIQRVVFRLIGIDKGRKYIEPVAGAGSRLRPPQAVNLLQRSFIVPPGADRLHLSVHALPRSRRSCRNPCACRSI